MASFWRDINSFTQGQKRALIVIWCLIICVLFSMFVRNKYFMPLDNNPEIDSLLTQLIATSIQKDFTPSKTEITDYFNPNIDSKEHMLEVGLPQNIAQNIIKLRNTGKIFTKPDDLKRLYGMTDSLFEIIKPFIVLGNNYSKKEFKYVKQKENKPVVIKHAFDPNWTSLQELISLGIPEAAAKGIVGYRTRVKLFEETVELLKVYTIDSLLYSLIKDSVFIVELKPVNIPLVKVEINTATATELIKASKVDRELVYKIMNYRNKLGGFYSLSQVSEIENIDSTSVINIAQSIWIDTIQIRKINLNHAEYKDLIKHPYFNREQVSKLLRYREFTKKIESFDELIKNKVLAKHDIQRLKYYLELE